MKVVVIISVIPHTIYFTLASIIFRSYHHWYLKAEIRIKKQLRNRKEPTERFSQEVFDCSEGGRPNFISHRFHDH